MFEVLWFRVKGDSEAQKRTAVPWQRGRVGLVWGVPGCTGTSLAPPQALEKPGGGVPASYQGKPIQAHKHYMANAW